MGLRLTLLAQNNHIGYTFEDAYWVIQDIRYEMKSEGLFLIFWLNCYPTRESSKLSNHPVQSLSIGKPMQGVFDGRLYEFVGLYPSEEVFPNGIPTSTDEQKRIIYLYIKDHVDLPFEDVFE